MTSKTIKINVRYIGVGNDDSGHDIYGHSVRGVQLFNVHPDHYDLLNDVDDTIVSLQAGNYTQTCMSVDGNDGGHELHNVSIPIYTEEISRRLFKQQV